MSSGIDALKHRILFALENSDSLTGSVANVFTKNFEDRAIAALRGSATDVLDFYKAHKSTFQEAANQLQGLQAQAENFLDAARNSVNNTTGRGYLGPDNKPRNTGNMKPAASEDTQTLGNMLEPFIGEGPAKFVDTLLGTGGNAAKGLFNLGADGASGWAKMAGIAFAVMGLFKGKGMLGSGFQGLLAFAAVMLITSFVGKMTGESKELENGQSNGEPKYETPAQIPDQKAPEAVPAHVVP